MQTKFKTRFTKPKGQIAIVPSVLSADFSDLKSQIKNIEKAGADWLQIDVMDGHFVPNISFGPGIVKTLSKISKLPLDAHLMIDNPQKFILPFANAGADLITVHYEVIDDNLSVIKNIKKLGIACGIAINPQTPVSCIKPFLKLVDLVLVMTVNPGFGGQKFIAGSLKRIALARKLLSESDKKIWLQVDGGIDLVTAPKVVSAGADSLVAGNFIFGAKNPTLALKDLCKSVQ